jgi:glycosyltransferase involved in cell wall biosynthesis
MATIGIDASRMTLARRTGTEQYSAHLVEALVQLPAGHRLLLYFNRPPEPRPSWPAQVALHEMPFPRLWTHLRLSWEMLRRPPDLLFVPAHVLPLVRPRRTVVTIHDLGYLFFPQAHPLRRRLELHWSTGWNARVASRVIAVSQATRDDLVQHYHVPPERIRVVYHGVEARFRPTADPAALARYHLPGRYLLYLGTLQPRKNLERLLEAYARLPLEAPPLVLAGAKGWYFGRIATALAALGLAGRVLLPGYIADADVPAVLSAATALLYPSLYEGFGLPALEAMACGTPVVVANASSLPEVVGQAGLLIDPLRVEEITAAIQRLLTDEGLRAELGRRGQERARLFSWERCARETMAVLEEALATGEHPPG